MRRVACGSMWRGVTLSVIPLPDLSCNSAIVTRPPLAVGFTLTAEAIIQYLRSPAIDLWRELSRVLKPGAHLLCFGGPFTFDLVAVGIRAAGFECRDTIAHQQAGPTWEPILVFRKPIEESTIARQVLKTGAGAINIEACRVSGAPRTTHKNGNFPNPHTRESEGWGFKTGVQVDTPSGRWPANLTLQHADCDDRGCIEGCPVKVLDGQSGVTTSGAMKYEVLAYAGESTTMFLRGKSGPSNQHGDTGGASRFFCQFQTDQQTLDWLVTLVTPAGRTTLILQPL